MKESEFDEEEDISTGIFFTTSGNEDSLHAVNIKSKLSELDTEGLDWEIPDDE